MNKVYVFTSPQTTIHIFGTARRLHEYLIENNYQVHYKFSTFNKWLNQDKFYQINNGAKVSIEDVL